MKTKEELTCLAAELRTFLAGLPSKTKLAVAIDEFCGNIEAYPTSDGVECIYCIDELSVFARYHKLMYYVTHDEVNGVELPIFRMF